MRPDFLLICRHWANFYTEDDISKLASVGVSHIRIPVGYWLVDVIQENEPFPLPPNDDNEGQRYYLKRLIKWAEKFELKVCPLIPFCYTATS